MKDPFIDLAKEAHYNIYESPMWNNTGRRFAELIVQKCAEIARQDILSRSGMNQQYDGRIITEDAIKNYFGLN